MITKSTARKWKNILNDLEKSWILRNRKDIPANLSCSRFIVIKPIVDCTIHGIDFDEIGENGYHYSEYYINKENSKLTLKTSDNNSWVYYAFEPSNMADVKKTIRIPLEKDKIYILPKAKDMVYVPGLIEILDEDVTFNQATIKEFKKKKPGYIFSNQMYSTSRNWSDATNYITYTDDKGNVFRWSLI